MRFTGVVLPRLTLAVGLFTLACKPTEFTGLPRQATLNSVGFPLSCEAEKSKSAQITNAETNVINIAKNCISESKSDKKPADIVFVIDITASMQDSINTVRNGVERFANQLRQDKGWDARYAAIAYRDQVTQTVPFTDEKNLSAAARSWIANGGDDPQEAGQSALAAAVQLLQSDATSNPSRAGASKIILYIADAVSYSVSGNRNDFSTTELEKSFVALPPTVKSQLRFYHSTALQIEGCVIATLFGCAKRGYSTELAANGQITALAQKLGLPGRGFEFPFTESIMLSEFIDEFVPGQSCVLRSAVAKGTNGKELGRSNDTGTIKLPAGTPLQAMQVDVERCCASSGSGAKPGSACTPVKTSLSIGVKK